MKPPVASLASAENQIWSESLALQKCSQLAQAGPWDALLAQALMWQKQQKSAHDPLYFAAYALRRLGQVGPALAYLGAALDQRPYTGAVLLERAGLLLEIGHFTQAQRDLEWAFLLRPHDLNVAGLMVQCLGRQNKWSEVSALLEQMTVWAPNASGLALSQATSWLHQREMARAAPYFEQALIESDNSPAVQWEYAMQLLMMEDFERGWDYHEARHQVFGWKSLNVLPLNLPRWEGQDLSDKTLLIHGEQGTGDEVMFASVIAELVAVAKQVWVACHPNLVDLFQTSFPDATIIPHARGNPGAWEKALPDWVKRLVKKNKPDYHISSSSLAHYTRRHAKDFPGTPYLKVTPERKERLGQALQQALARGAEVEKPFANLPGAGIKIGLAWSGNLSNPTAALRSTPLSTLRPLRDALPGAQFISLQSKQYAHQIAEVPEMRLIDTSAHTDNFADLAALMHHLDLVITVDTSYVHIAAGSGVPTWLMQSRRGEWRWGWQRKHPLWYRCVQLFWQPTQGDWASVIAAMAEELKTRFGTPHRS
jgi:tetratricopeptide (TPR) repeat protein